MFYLEKSKFEKSKPLMRKTIGILLLIAGIVIAGFCSFYLFALSILDFKGIGQLEMSFFYSLCIGSIVLISYGIFMIKTKARKSQK